MPRGFSLPGTNRILFLIAVVGFSIDYIMPFMIPFLHLGLRVTCDIRLSRIKPPYLVAGSFFVIFSSANLDLHLRDVGMNFVIENLIWCTQVSRTF
jgi:hypothetical protein